MIVHFYLETKTMQVISSVLVIDDDVAVAKLIDGAEVPLAIEWRDGNQYYKVKQGNKIVPVWTPASGVMFSDLTRWTYK